MIKTRLGQYFFILFVCAIRTGGIVSSQLSGYTQIQGTNLFISPDGIIVKGSGDVFLPIDQVVAPSEISGSTQQSGQTIKQITESTQQGPLTPQQELEEAIKRMYENKITSFNTIETFRPNDFLTREESAKLVNQTYNVLNFSGKQSTTNCAFSDITNADPTLVPHIIQSCQKGLFQGFNNKFFPFNQISKPEITAVLIRMFEQKQSAETMDPRRTIYFEKARLIGLTNETDVIKYNKTITRGEIARFIIRLKNIVNNPQQKQAYLNTISTIGPVRDQGILSQSTIDANLPKFNDQLGLFNKPEFQAALFWMYDNNLTQFNNTQDFQPLQPLTREQGVKMLGELYQKRFAGSGKNTFIPSECVFSDINQVATENRIFITQLCQAGVIKGGQAFRPQDSMIKSEFFVLLIRMIEGKKLDETKNPRRQDYFIKAKELGLALDTDIISFEKPITRYEVALILYNFSIRYRLLSNLNNNRLNNHVVIMVDNTVSTNEKKQKQGKVLINSFILKQLNNDIGYISLFDNNYKIIKTSIEEVFNNNFVWYGDVYDLVEDKKIGTINFIVSNNYVIEGQVRPISGGALGTYTINGQGEQQIYYLLTEINPGK